MFWRRHTEISLDCGADMKAYLIDEDNFFRETNEDISKLKENQVIYLES